MGADVVEEEFLFWGRRGWGGDVAEGGLRGLFGLWLLKVKDEFDLALVAHCDGGVGDGGDGPAVLLFEEVGLGCGLGG